MQRHLNNQFRRSASGQRSLLLSPRIRAHPRGLRLLPLPPQRPSNLVEGFSHINTLLCRSFYKVTAYHFCQCAPFLCRDFSFCHPVALVACLQPLILVAVPPAVRSSLNKTPFPPKTRIQFRQSPADSVAFGFILKPNPSVAILFSACARVLASLGREISFIGWEDPMAYVKRTENTHPAMMW